MRVIKDNTQGFPKEVKCVFCGSVVEIEGEEDFGDTRYTWRQYVSHDWICPCCGKPNYIQIPNKTTMP